MLTFIRYLESKWKRKEDKDGKVKYSFCMVPTLVKKNGEVIDYFEDREKDKKDQEYNHDNDEKEGREALIGKNREEVMKRTNGEFSNAFDNGHLWP